MESAQSLRLAIELVPEPCWYSNMRKVLTVEQWDTLRRSVYQAHNNRCAICGTARGPGSWLHCHEIWEYDDASHVQTLRGFTALCEWCHHVKHIGLSQILALDGKLDYKRVVEHFMHVNNCDRETFNAHHKAAFATWRERSEHEWRTELGEYAALITAGKE